MVRNYEITWHLTKEEKYGKVIDRTNIIRLSRPTGKTEIDAKNAVDLFTRGFGNLKKNTIVCIKEFGENGQIGEDIVPSNTENAIIPIKR